MPIKFRSKTYASVLMLDETAKRFLEIMNLKVSPPGALRSEDIAPALEKLKSHIAVLDEGDSLVKTDALPTKEEPVSLRNRALPLIGLLQHAINNDEIVTWNAA